MDCDFCGRHHTSTSCYHPGYRKFLALQAEVERLQSDLTAANSVADQAEEIADELRAENERLRAVVLLVATIAPYGSEMRVKASAALAAGRE